MRISSLQLCHSLKIRSQGVLTAEIGYINGCFEVFI